MKFYNTKRIPYRGKVWMPDYDKGNLMEPYKPSENTKGREFMNTVLFPHFAKFFKDGDTIYNIGKHGFWDYSLFFNNFERRCNFIITDIEPEMEPDIVDDITKSKLPDASADGITFVGMWDIIGDRVSVLANFYRILKPGGRFIFSCDLKYENDLSKNSTLQNILMMMNKFLIDEIYFVYEPVAPGWTEMYTNGPVTAAFIIARKPK